MRTLSMKCRRVSKGRPVATDLSATILPCPVVGTCLAIAVRKPTGKVETNHYTLKEIPSTDGRAFLLIRDEEAVWRERCRGLAPTTQYGVEIGRNGRDLCECRGFERFGYCKHVDAMRQMVVTGAVDHVDPELQPPQGDEQYQEEVKEWEKELERIEQDADE